MKNKAIAIYSGEIPSTTFIERLIIGLSKDNFIYLFGYQKKQVKYPKNIKLVTYSTKISKLLLLIKYTVLLLHFKPKEKRQLDAIIANQKGNKIIKKVKYYPVLYHKPAIFHLQWAKGIEDWIWVQQFGIKLVLSLRGAHINYTPITLPKYKEVYNYCFPKVDGFHAVSSAILNESLIYGAVKSKIKTIYSGLNLNELIYKPKLHIHSKLKIVSIGRSHWKKGYHYALDACSILKQENFNFQYTIIGIENDEELLFQRNQLNLDNCVTFVTKVPFHKIMEQIYVADVVLLPSVEEGIANVILEAMALGTLVIATNCGGMEEVVVPNENGYIVPIRNSEAIATAIKKAGALSLENYNSITLQARKVMEKQHSNEKMIADFNTFYQSLFLNKTP